MLTNAVIFLADLFIFIQSFNWPESGESVVFHQWEYWLKKYWDLVKEYDLIIRKYVNDETFDRTIAIHRYIISPPLSDKLHTVGAELYCMAGDTYLQKGTRNTSFVPDKLASCMFQITAKKILFRTFKILSGTAPQENQWS